MLLYGKTVVSVPTPGYIWKNPGYIWDTSGIHLDSIGNIWKSRGNVDRVSMTVYLLKPVDRNLTLFEPGSVLFLFLGLNTYI